MSWKPHRDPIELDTGARVQTLRSAESSEGAHDVHLTGHTIRVYPDGTTTTRKRYDTISRAATAASAAARATDGDETAFFVGLCVTAGLTRLEIDGTPLIDREQPLIGRIEADVYGDEIRIRVREYRP